jgi:radical SAM superfamily enzyme YgiQ (UPF0313 family)
VRKVVLINPANSTVGYSFITPRWLFVIAQATPIDLVGEPVIVDETIEGLNEHLIEPGDIVGIGINTGNCLSGYRTLRTAKRRGATVIMGGVHSTIFPEEPIEMGADAVITGNGDVVWSKALRDALDGRLDRLYVGGRIPGDSMLKARWNMLDTSKYLFPSVQTVAGCPENCSFCSVWVTDGRHPRQRLTDKIIEEVNELYERGYRCLLFADDNFNPATLGRIARETSPAKRKELEQVREERLRFFEIYDRSVPRDMFGLTQMTSELVSDEEYISAMYSKMRIRGGLIGVESFSEEGLKTVGKQWNPVGEKMVETIHKIQEHGIWVLGSIITGIESDTVQSIRTMRNFATQSGAVVAQFTFYAPYPGTKDFYEMMNDFKHRDKPDFVPKHKIRVKEDRFWLKPVKPTEVIDHPNITRKQLLAENEKCWNTYYSLKQCLHRIRHGEVRTWPWPGKIGYLFGCMAFRRIYGGQGVSADSVKAKKGSWVTRFCIRTMLRVYSHFFDRRKAAAQVPAPVQVMDT